MASALALVVATASARLANADISVSTVTPCFNHSGGPFGSARQVAAGREEDRSRVPSSRLGLTRYAVHAETMPFPKGKTKFIRPDGSVGRSPGHGVVLLGVGEVANDALRNSGLSFVVSRCGVL